jgi:hypothetical protein
VNERRKFNFNLVWLFIHILQYRAGLSEFGSGTQGNVKILLILPDEDLRDFRSNYKWPLNSHQRLKVDFLIFVLNI